MFDTAPVLWLQSWASPALTQAMNVVSLWGYFPSTTAAAAVYAFGGRLRSGVVLLLTVALAAVFTDAAKATFRMPRPSDVDSRVHTLSTFQYGPVDDEDAASTAMPDGRFGFPSGHAAAATALAAGLWSLLRRRWLIGAGCAWVAVTAVSRIYLGRHFIGDIAGGVGIGALTVLLWKPMRLTAVLGPVASGRGALTLLWVTSFGAALLSLVTGTVHPVDAGRLSGLAAAVAIGRRWDLLGDARTLTTRAVQVIVALVLVGLTVAAAPIGTTLESAWRAGYFGLEVLLNAGIVLVPALLLRVSR